MDLYKKGLRKKVIMGELMMWTMITYIKYLQIEIHKLVI